MSKSDQLNLLQTYSKRLEDENQAKTKQIKLLRQQLQKAVTSSTTTTRIVSSSSMVANCLNCKNKDTEIANLNKTIKELKENHEKQIQRINSTASTKVEKQIVYTNSHSKEFQSLKKEYEQLKVKYDEAQKKQWSTIRVDEGLHLQSARQVELLKEENNLLCIKIQELEKRLSELQISRPTTTYISHLQPSTISYVASAPPVNTPIIQSPLQIPISETRPIHSYVVSSPPLTPTFKISPSQNFYNKHSYPLFHTSYSHLGAVSKYDRLNRQASFHYASPTKYCDCSHLSPLKVYSKKYDQSYTSDYEKDIVEERWKSLKHKIKILQEENGKLRSEIHTVQY